MIRVFLSKILLIFLFIPVHPSCSNNEIDKTKSSSAFNPTFKLVSVEKFTINNFVDCNMAEAWISDTFRIFPGKYGEDIVWGNSRELKFASGVSPFETFGRDKSKFTEPILPANAAIGGQELHGAIWFETIYQDNQDTSGKTLYAIYHNENYPENFPYNPATGEGYLKMNWPESLRGPKSSAAVCRIGIMKSADGGRSWENKGILLKDLQPRMILKPYNNSKTFAGGVGDPPAVASGEFLYLFYGEYAYPGVYDEKTYNARKEWGRQCISVARIPLKDLDDPAGKVRRWDGKGFNAGPTEAGEPISSLQIPIEKGGGPASSANGGFYWGPSVSWNEYLNSWVMLMAKATGPSWKGSNIYISFNNNKDLGEEDSAQQWTQPQLLLEMKGYTLWYPSLQPMNTTEDLADKRTCLRLGQQARLFIKYNGPDNSEYASGYVVEFEK